MRFAEPIWLIVGAVSLVPLVFLLARAEVLRTRALALLSGTWSRPALEALPSPARRWLRVLVVTLAVALGFVALARPQKGMHWETIRGKGIDLLLVVDTSHSMDSDDVKPSRLARAKLAIRDLVERFPGDRIGLVAFSGDAFVQSPMTLDHAALLDTVDSLDTSIIARGGTNLGRAIEVATAALATEPSHVKEMVLLSDGEDLEGQGLEQAKKAQALGITIDAVGVGTTAGELVPALNERGKAVDVVRDEHGQPVRSRLDEAGLTAITQAGHGAYRPFGVDGQGLDRLYTEVLAGRAPVATSSRSHRVYSERFQLPLALSLLALVIDALLGRAWRPTLRRSRTGAPAAAATIASVLLVLAHGRAYASTGEAAKAYAAGKFEQAQQQYEAASARDPKDPRLAFNAGDAAYKAGHYDVAHRDFARALRAADPKLRERLLYNLGDTQYRAGEGRPAQDHAQTIEQWKAAIASYDKALALDAKDADARFNRDFVQRKLEELEKQPQPPPPPKPSQGKQGQSGANAKSNGDGKADKSAGKANKPGEQAGNNASKPEHTASGDKGKQPAPSSAGGQPNESAASDPLKPADAGDPDAISPRDARALLSALRDEDHHGVPAATRTGTSRDNAPRKDW